ncbi:MAG: YitT family protein [Lachnospiraceae bacterium]|nr:YitT family protein [Lachnospiraceae bacterium]
MRKRILKKLRAKDVLVILLGSTLIAVALKYVFDPAGLVTGGVSGLAIIAKETGARYGIAIPLWLSMVVFNVPIFLLALKTDGFRGILRTGLCWFLLSAELAILPEPFFPADNLLLVSLYGGILFGLGTGILLSVRATSGGTDLLANSIIHFVAGRELKPGSSGIGAGIIRRFKQISYGSFIAVLDGIIVALGTLVFGLEHTLFAIISIYVTSKVTDTILNRGKDARMVLIISDEDQTIAETILREMDRGVTALHATGMYKGMDRKVLLCICSRRDIVDVKEIVREHDPAAFFVIGRVSEVMGEGFIENWS